MTITIKPMESPEEIAGKAYVHWKSCHETYDGLLPDAYQESITPERCREITLERYQEWEKSYQVETQVVLDDDAVVGFITYGKSREALPSTAEIYLLYVLADYQGRKIGYQLMTTAIQDLQGVSKVVLWVLVENSRSIDFYQHYGFRYDGQEKMIELGEPVLTKRMILEIR